MSRFWKHKPEKPLVWNHNGWYYSVEYYGITHNFIDIEALRELGIEIADGTPWPRSWPRVWTKNGFPMLRWFLRVRYLHFRHRSEIANLFEQAYMQFSSDLDDEDVGSQY